MVSHLASHRALSLDYFDDVIEGLQYGVQDESMGLQIFFVVQTSSHPLRTPILPSTYKRFL